MKLTSDTISKQRSRLASQLSELNEIEASGLCDCDIPGRLVLSFNSNRIVVATLDELHGARSAIRAKFGKWNDTIANKFYSGGDVVATYRPCEDGSPFSFKLEIWVEAPPALFPSEILGKCRLVESGTKDYNVICER